MFLFVEDVDVTEYAQEITVDCSVRDNNRQLVVLLFSYRHLIDASVVVSYIYIIIVQALIVFQESFLVLAELSQCVEYLR